MFASTYQASPDLTTATIPLFHTHHPVMPRLTKTSDFKIEKTNFNR
ncbi:hypothetical protein NAB1_3425 [Lactiplantibacillus plantarum]|nr:hypothetical protein NAB1_3425 [Lactiplantibacillus plantarum]